MSACTLDGICGGCRYSAMPYEEQLEMKESQLLALLKDVLSDGSAWEGIIPSPSPYGYRNKMEYSFGDDRKDGPLTLGMHRMKSFYSVVTCDCCLLVHPDFNVIVRAVRDFFDERGIPYVHKRSHEGYLRHLLLRRSAADGNLMIDLVTKSDKETVTRREDCGEVVMSEELLAQFRDMLLELPLEGRISGILHTCNDSLADAVKDEGTELLYGQDYLTESLFGLSFKITPFSFFQTNTEGAKELYGKVKEYVGDTEGMVVYDLYCGTGTITQIAAQAAREAYGIELVEEAVEAAQANAASNGLTNCHFIAGDVLKVIDGVAQKPDYIILDPPRDGLHPKMLPKIIDYGVDHIVYVACKPESFVRDMASFAAAGYEIARACAVDMFPNTRHTELVVLLSRVGGK